MKDWVWDFFCWLVVCLLIIFLLETVTQSRNDLAEQLETIQSDTNALSDKIDDLQGLPDFIIQNNEDFKADMRGQLKDKAERIISLEVGLESLDSRLRGWEGISNNSFDYEQENYMKGVGK